MSEKKTLNYLLFDFVCEPADGSRWEPSTILFHIYHKDYVPNANRVEQYSVKNVYAVRNIIRVRGYPEPKNRYL